MKYFLSVIILLSISCCEKKKIIDYGEIPMKFTPELIPNNSVVHAGRFSPDLSTYYITLSNQSFTRFNIYESKYINNEWTQIEESFFNSEYLEHGICFTNSGNQLFFSSTRPCDANATTNSWQIWRIRKTNNEWNEPRHVDIPGLENKLISHPSITNNGRIYFHAGETDYSNLNLYYTEYHNGGYINAVKLPAEVNISDRQVTPFIAPDESYIIFESYSKLYISEKNEDGEWTMARELNEDINRANRGNPYVSPDGNYLFYAAASGEELLDWDIYFVPTASFLGTIEE